MTRQQKIILITLAILDIAMIGAMGTYAVTTTQRNRRLQLTSDFVTDPDPCVGVILDALAEPNNAAVISWSPSGAFIEVTRSAAISDTPPEEFIWELIDRLPATTAVLCPATNTVTLVAHTGIPHRSTQTVVFAGSDLAHWLRGDLSDDDLAAQSQYRIVLAP